MLFIIISFSNVDFPRETFLCVGVIDFMLCVEMMAVVLCCCLSVWVWIGSFCRSKKKKRDSVVGRSLVIIVIFVGGFSLSLSHHLFLLTYHVLEKGVSFSVYFRFLNFERERDERERT